MNMLTRMMLHKKMLSMKVERDKKVPRKNKVMPTLSSQMVKSKTSTAKKKLRNEKRKRRRARMWRGMSKWPGEARKR